MPTTSNFGWTTPADTDLVKDGAAAIRTLGNGVDSSFVDLKGGTSGQILAKNSNTDLDFVWVANDQGDITAVTAGTGISGGGTSGAVTITNSMATEITAKGDLIVGTGSGTFDNLPAGTNGYTLVADSSVSPTGLKWAAPAGGGKVLQVVSASTTSTTTISSSTYTDTGITATITPTASNSTILVLIMYNAQASRSAGEIATGAKILRGASTIAEWQDYAFLKTKATGATATEIIATSTLSYQDNPATTSATTYKLQAKLDVTTSSASLLINPVTGVCVSTITLLEIGA